MQDRKNNEGKWIPTTCAGCFNACAIRVLVKDGKVVNIKGEPTVTGSLGKICGKGLARIADLYDPNRITKPLKRTNPKKGMVLIRNGWRLVGKRPWTLFLKS